MAANRSLAWHWPVALVVALLLHGLVAWWLLTNSEAQSVAEATNPAGVVISLASPGEVEPGSQPGNEPETAAALETAAESSAADLPQSASAELSPDSFQAVAEEVTPHEALDKKTDKPAAPDPAPATSVELPTATPDELPIAKTYAIPAEELKAMQDAERQEAAEQALRQQARRKVIEQQRLRRITERNRQQAIIQQQAAQQTRRRQITTNPESSRSHAPVSAARKTSAPTGVVTDQAATTGDSGSTSNPAQSRAGVTTASVPEQGSDKIPDCSDDSDIGGDSRKAQYKKVLRRYLQARQKYPRRAAQRRQQGCVVAQISINPQGQITAASLIRKSGYRLLDSAALKLVKPGRELPAPPATASSAVFRIPFDYRLN